MAPPYVILIVDDEPEILESLKRVFRGPQYTVLTTTSPREALAIIEGGAGGPRVDLLISDIDMPGMTGVELVARVKRSRPEVMRMLLTGGVSFEKAVRAINEGEVYRYLTKPWDRAELRETIRQALERLEEYRRAAAAERSVALRDRVLAELESAHPGIAKIERVDGDYVLDTTRLDARAETLEPMTLRAFFLPSA